MTKNFYITTPIYYVNDVPHIGHAYTSLSADVIARFKRLDGYNVMFLTGTDEHGQKIERSAEKMQMDAQTFTDKLHLSFKNLNHCMNFSNDDFIRTSEKRHKDYVTQVWQELVENGNIYLGKYSGWYAIRDEAYYDEAELIDGRAPTGAEVVWLDEPSYFFKLSNYSDKLLQFYEENPEFIMPISRRNEVIAFVKSGLMDLSVSRTSFKWGIKVPGDESHVIYVWLDALFNYISALNNRNLWPADLHIVGKDILRFHAVYWPAFLMALGMPLPEKIFAHGWWTNEGQKISKSIGNVIDPIHLIEKYGLDYVRYYLMKEIPFGNDGNYSQESFFNRVNADLANNIGNLIQRVLSFIYNNCSKMIPCHNGLELSDQNLLDLAYNAIDKIRCDIDQNQLHTYIERILNISRSANEYIDIEAPWKLKSTNVSRMNSVLFVLAETIRVIAILMQPIVPSSASKILDFLQIKDRDFKHLVSGCAIKADHNINQPSGVFMRMVLK